MERIRSILYNITFFFICLLVFLTVFYGWISVPSWVKVFGRMHPMMLHFPIVLIIFYIVWALWITPRYPAGKEVGKVLLLTATLTAAITAIMGIILSKEDGYDADALALHKWSGIAVAILSFTWYILDNRLAQHKILLVATASVVFVLLVVAGDLGAGITHGQDYLLAPVLPQKQPHDVSIEEAMVYRDMVQPILEAKCVGCHNNKKAKGELIMETSAQLLKGGKDGVIWDTAHPDLSLVLQRIHLPEEEEKHMPPQGKPQLTEEEINILYFFIKDGASFTKKVTDLPTADTLRILANKIFRKPSEEQYDFAAADEKQVQQLNNNNRVLRSLALNSPALTATFYNSENYSGESLKELSKVKEQLVSLNMAHMPVSDEDVNTIATFTNLRNLNLNFTAVTGKSIAQLKKLTHLKELSLSGTAVTINDLEQVASIASLKKVFAWNTSITDKEAAAIVKPGVSKFVETGFNSDTMIMKLSMPVLQNEESVITGALPLKLKHYINGVDIRYTLDGTEPDSTRSPVYDKNVTLDKAVTVKAKAFKKGWISSDILTAEFYKSTYTPDSAILLSAPDVSYKGDGGKTVIDRVKSEQDFRNGKWLGYHGTKAEILLLFNSPVKTAGISISSLVDIGGYIMPPQFVEVWGGDDASHLKLLSRQVPKQPDSIGTAHMPAYILSYPPTQVRYLKVTAQAVAKLPVWHPGKGDKGWFFVDEIFVN
ncbi:MAG TPA: FN3 associated domain-containing protein [Panacibacter sp.]|nr:FN3 associated domain-containing protein [Panacibacter sp.]HNP44703.1 FN3 associated domain-containing protein [Panacibacter sp.]